MLAWTAGTVLAIYQVIKLVIGDGIPMVVANEYSPMTQSVIVKFGCLFNFLFGTRCYLCRGYWATACHVS